MEDEQEHPDSLFHYTNASGLLGIVQDEHLWASNCRFLNDAEEWIYAHSALLDALERMEGGPDAEIHESVSPLRLYRDLVDGALSAASIFVSCFCEDGDLLSQWRAYGNDHGYALELDGEHLSAMGVKRVAYGMSSVAHLVAGALTVVATSPTAMSMEFVRTQAMLVLAAPLALVKHQAFREEREWRLLRVFSHPMPPVGDYEPLFRATDRAIVPYVQCGLPRSVIRSIAVGPGRDVALRRAGVERLMERFGLDVPVTVSGVPLR